MPRTIVLLQHALVASLLVLGGCQRRPPEPVHALDLAHQIPGRDLRADPPVVDDVSFMLLANPTAVGNVQIRVQFAAAERIPAQLTVQLDDQTVTLRDDGAGGDDAARDGIHAGIIQVNLDEWRRTQARLASRADTLPTFDGRRRIPARSVRELLPELRPGRVIKLPPGLAAAVDAERSLLIRDPSVVQDPTRTRTSCAAASMGKWSFGYLMEQMANQADTGITPSDFVMRWLQRWQFDQTVNDLPVPSRPNIQSLIIDPWVAASGGPGNPLDLSRAPFRLLAIVNRIDLRQNIVYGGGSAGEARFVFGAIGPGCQPLQFTVIFEYGITKANCMALKAWGQQWKDLDQNPIGSAPYNAALEAITEQFVTANAAPTKPNGSALNQLRTNEIALAAPWELREFRLFDTDSDAHHLRLVTVKQTPDLAFNNTAALATYVNANATAIIDEAHDVPLHVPPGVPFLGGSALTPPGVSWNHAAITPRDARHMFSLQTCNGCHAGETDTDFTHVKPASFGATTAALSGFMTGITVVDPADGTPSRVFADLQRRAADLDNLLNQPCFLFAFEPVLRMTH